MYTLYVCMYNIMLLLLQELGDRAVEAQACYSLGNTYTLLKENKSTYLTHLNYLTHFYYW